MEKHNFNKEDFSLNRQPLVIYLFTSFTFLLILIRLIFLQLVNYENYKNLSDENRIRLIASQPIRGLITDKNGFILADSKIKYSLIIKPQYVTELDWKKYKSKLSILLDTRSELLQKRYIDGLKYNDLSITLLDDLTVDQIIKFKENEKLLNGIEISNKVIRNYPYKTLASHVIGYTQPITDSEFSILSKKGYKLNAGRG